MPRHLLLTVILAVTFASAFSQSLSLQQRLNSTGQIEAVGAATTDFQEAYSLLFTQSLDHNNPGSKLFKQKAFLIFKAYDAPTVIVTEGYGIPKFHYNELATELNANLLMVEHRLQGNYISNDEWQYLTVKQASDDYHHIKKLLEKIFTGKWVSMGISKGGQAALAYRTHYPTDVVATVVYGTAVKNKPIVTTDTLLYSLSQTECGKKVVAFQEFCFRNKLLLLEPFNKLNLDIAPLDNETVLDYMLLEFPYSFWQGGRKCDDMIDTVAPAYEIMTYVTQIIDPRYYSQSHLRITQPAFYMFYHELGYYEYNSTPFKKWLKQDSYSNKYFAPKVDILFDDSYQKALGAFLQTPDAASVFFIHGEYDPWALQTTVTKNVFIVKAGSHNSRIADLDPAQKDMVISNIRGLLK